MLTKSEMTISMVTPKSFSELLLLMAASLIFMEVIITIYGGNKIYWIKEKMPFSSICFETIIFESIKYFANCQFHIIY